MAPQKRASFCCKLVLSDDLNTIQGRTSQLYLYIPYHLFAFIYTLNKTADKMSDCFLVGPFNVKLMMQQ